MSTYGVSIVFFGLPTITFVTLKTIDNFFLANRRDWGYATQSRRILTVKQSRSIVRQSLYIGILNFSAVLFNTSFHLMIFVYRFLASFSRAGWLRVVFRSDFIFFYFFKNIFTASFTTKICDSKQVNCIRRLWVRAYFQFNTHRQHISIHRRILLLFSFIFLLELFVFFQSFSSLL